MHTEQPLCTDSIQAKHDAGIGELHEEPIVDGGGNKLQEGGPMRPVHGETNAKKVVSYVTDPSHLYRCAFDPTGKKARVCIATPSCAAQPVYLLRRDALERHLWQAHHVFCFVPGGFNMEDNTSPRRKNKRSRQRFYDMEYKWDVARKKYARSVQKKAAETYKGLLAEMKILQDEEAFVQAQLQQMLAEYDSKKELKMKRVQDRISRGYELATRDGRVHIGKQTQHLKTRNPHVGVENVKKGAKIVNKPDEVEQISESMHPLEDGITISSGADEGDEENEHIGRVEVVHGFVSRSPNLQSWDCRVHVGKETQHLKTTSAQVGAETVKKGAKIVKKLDEGQQNEKILENMQQLEDGITISSGADEGDEENEHIGRVEVVHGFVGRCPNMQTWDGRVHIGKDTQHLNTRNAQVGTENVKKGAKTMNKPDEVEQVEKISESMHPLEDGITLLSGADEGDEENEHVGQVEVVHGFVSRSPNMQPNSTLRRFEITCRRLNLAFSLSRKDVEQVAQSGVMASTTHMNLFTCWKEFILPLDTCRDMWILDPFWLQHAQIGKLRQVIGHVPTSVKVLFIPVCYRGHWTLYVAINYIGHGITALNGRKGILFMDSMNSCPLDWITSLVKNMVETVYCQWGRSKDILQGQVVSLVIPAHPNGFDCGWYVMHCIDCFLEDILQGLLSSRFGTFGWFTHADVDDMRRGMRRWARRMLSN